MKKCEEETCLEVYNNSKCSSSIIMKIDWYVKMVSDLHGYIKIFFYKSVVSRLNN